MTEERCPECGRPVQGAATGGLCPECALSAASTAELPAPEADPRMEPGDGARDGTAERFAPGTVLGHRYRIVSMIGRGGMGEVYRADDLKLGQTVALKFLPPALARDARLFETLCNEVRQARRVSHRHVCRVYDIGEADGQPFLTMEFVEGEDLGALLRKVGRLPAPKAIELARQLCEGLAAAHEQGLLHLDLKPGNLLIDHRGNLLITDFGLARLPENEEAAFGRMAGTPAYMSPEQALGRELTPGSDLYALGLVLYEMFTGVRVNGERTPREIVEWHREGGSPDPPSRVVPSLDPAIERAILRCLERDPARRPDSVGALLEEFGARQEAGPARGSARHGGGADPVPGAGKSLAALMFTDIVGSVELQQRLGTDEYTRFVARHDAIFNQCLAEAPGAAVLNETGDGFLVRFPDPADAVKTALRLQARLGNEVAGGQPVGIRIGINMGVVTEMSESLRGERRVVGMPINIAARIMDLAMGGQILVTRPVYDDARHYVREPPDGSGAPLRWVSHGRYAFKGGDEALEVFEVGVEGVAPLQAPPDSVKAWRDPEAGGRAHPAPGSPAVSGAAVRDDAEPITVDDIVRSDVLISYAPVDDLPLASGGEGWVSRFHRNLSVRLEQLCGEHVNVLRCPRQPETDIPDAVIPSVGRVRTMVPVVSPPFVKSDKCCRVVEAFGSPAAAGSSEHKSLLKAVKTPVARDEIPARLAPVLQESIDYAFYDEDPESGRLREFDEAFGTDAQKRYYERVYDLAFEVAKSVKAARRRAASEAPPRSAVHTGRTIFLAEATSDLQAARDRLRRELLDEGHEVLPDRPLPMVAEELEPALGAYLARCDFAIHFVGGRYGLIPDGASESLAVLQNRAAARRSAEAGLARVVWVPRDVDVQDERQGAFIRALEEEPDAHRGAEVIRDTIENLKGYLRDRWAAEADARRKAEQRAAAQAGGTDSARAPLAGGAAPRVYLICDQRDEEAIEALEDFLFDQGIEVLLPEHSGEETEISEVHWANLADCDAALIYYGAAGKSWVDYKLRELVKAAGYRDGRAIDHQAVYVAPPSDRRKERFRSLSAPVLRQDGDAFDPAVLAGFVQAVKGGVR